MAKKIFARYSNRTMELTLNVLVSKGMFTAVKDYTDNYSGYVRTLIMQDLNIDENGKPLKKSK